MDPWERDEGLRTIRELDPELYELIRHEVTAGVLGGNENEDVNDRVRSAIMADPELQERYAKVARRAGWIPEEGLRG